MSDRILSIIQLHKLSEPFPIQKQAIPAIMAGRDVIGIAKTGSGKTLAFLLPMFRHILDQPPLRDSEGPIGLVMAPARELAFQISNEAKKFTKPLGMRVTCIYGIIHYLITTEIHQSTLSLMTTLLYITYLIYHILSISITSIS